MAEVAIVFELVEFTTGLWCRPCALSTGVRLTLMVTSPTRSSLSTVYRCAECGDSDVEPEVKD